MRSSSRIILIMGAALAALGSDRGVSAKPNPRCTVDQFTFDSVRSVVSEGQGYGKRVVEYAARGTTTLSGAECPLDGRTIGVGAAGVVTYDWDFDAGAGTSSGRVVIEWDLDNDGVFDMRFTGHSRGINDQTPADWNEVIEAHSDKGAKLLISTTVTVDSLGYKDNLTAWGASSID